VGRDPGAVGRTGTAVSVVRRRLVEEEATAQQRAVLQEGGLVALALLVDSA